MNPKKLRRQFERLRAKAKGGLSSDEVERLAKALGRVKSKRGKHPTYESALFPELMPLAIQHHGVKVPGPTATRILDELELDMQKIEETYGDEH